MGVVAWVGVLRIAEPLQHFQHISPVTAVTVYFRLFRNRRFAGLTLSLSVMMFPLFGFVAGAPDVYMSHFGMDERQFGYFFGFNALAAMIGAFSFTRLSRRFLSGSIMTVCFIGVMVAGGLMLLLPHHSPWSLAFPMWILTFFLGLSRPPSNNLMLEQVDRDVGAASSLIVFTFMTVGAISMGFISLVWADKITVLGVMASIVGTATLAFWLKYRQRFFSPLGNRHKSGREAKGNSFIFLSPVPESLP